MGKGDHYLPRFYLKYFEDPASKIPGRTPYLWKYEKGHALPKQKGVCNVASRKGFDKLFDKDGKKYEDFDNLLRWTEGNASHVLRELSQGDFEHVWKEIGKLAPFMGLLSVRVPKFRNAIRDALDKAVDKLSPLAAELSILLMDASIYTEFSRRFTNIVPYVIQRGVSNTFSLFNNKAWYLLMPDDDSRFLTSDMPIVTWCSSEENKFYCGVIDRTDAETTFPLSPSLVLVIKAGKQGYIRKVRAEVIQKVNMRTIIFADLIVSSRKMSKDEENILGIRTVDGKLIWGGEPKNLLLDFVDELNIE